MNKSRKDILIIGFALFSMFFGAGNLIFPPYLGLQSAPHWMLGFVCYYIADLGLALLTLFAILKRGTSDKIMTGLGKIPANIMMCVVVLCIGPMVAIPRTAATTYEMSIEPVFGSSSSVLFSILFFGLIFMLCIKESAVIDIVGKFLTPLLVIGLLVLIIKGVISPIGPIADTSRIDNIAESGIKSGYQTLDVLATMVFGVLILKTTEDKGYTDNKEKNKIVAMSGCIAGIGLLLAYMGLTYLGATASTFYSNRIDRSRLVTSIVKNLLGHTGVIIFAIIVALACITTALALVSSSASYFTKLASGKISYRTFVIIICLVSAVLSNIGLDTIVSIASPVLDIIYPPILVMVILTFFTNENTSILLTRFAVYGSLISGLLITINENEVFCSYIQHLPLYSLGFGWVLPTMISGSIGWILSKLLYAR